MLYLTHIELAEANLFVRQHHRHHGKIQGHRFSLAAVAECRIVGVVIVGRPVGGHHQSDWVEITRLCTDGTRNVCSFLYGAAARAAKELGFARIQTYILEAEFGVSLKASGWKYERLSHPIGWHHDTGRPAREVKPELAGRKQLWFKDLQEAVIYQSLGNATMPRSGFFNEL